MKKEEIKTIDTNIKFEKSERSTGNPIGFISKIDGIWRGVKRHDPVKKLIVVVDRKIAPFIKEDVVYNCHLVPMTIKNGYVAVQAAMIKYDARVEGRLYGGYYVVSVLYGNASITYDPTSTNPLNNDLGIVTERIRECPQIRNVDSVVKEFTERVYDLQNDFMRFRNGDME